MKALIFNSGLGKRMGKLTETTHKSMVRLVGSEETIFERQLRLLSQNGIRDYVITTGPFSEQLDAVMKQERFNNLNFSVVPNRIYDETNYIYSMYLARDYLDDDILMMHGDLVFNEGILRKVMYSKHPSAATVNKYLPKPEKDFKARLDEDYITEVGVSIFDEDCYAFQPLYKLSKSDMAMWLDKVCEFIEDGNNKVYAENALNEITDKVKIMMISYEEDYIDEVDNIEDLQRVSSQIREYDR